MNHGDYGRDLFGLHRGYESRCTKVFVAGFDTETNTFAPLPTGRRAFEDGFIAHGDATSQPENYCSAQLNVWRREAEELGWHVVESLCAFAEPGGIMVRAVYEGFRDEILADLGAAMPVDAVILALHGAMVAEGYDDCEGDLLQRIRAMVGEHVPIGAELDLHCHITETMVRNATALVTYKEYPHIDIPDRAKDLFCIIADATEGRTRPMMGAASCRMIGTYRTTEQPLRGFVDRMSALEGRDGIISVSLGHGFPWGDVADVGTKMLVVADGDRGKAERLARGLADEFFAMREAVTSRFLTVDEAIDRALAIADGPVVIADVSDNPGGGAPGDATFFLRRVLERGLSGVASGYYWDPMAVRACAEAGVGARLALRIGGKSGLASGDPVDLNVTVRGLAGQVTQRFGAAPVPMGESAWVEAAGVHLILTRLRTQVFHPEGMTKLGLDLGGCKLVIVKSTQHFHAGFAPIAKAIFYASPPGALRSDFADIPYTKLRAPYWPRVANPFES
jgi:microcystin degradation protein MlrC